MRRLLFLLLALSLLGCPPAPPEPTGPPGPSPSAAPSVAPVASFRYPRAIDAGPEQRTVYLADKQGWLGRLDLAGRLVAEAEVPEIERGTPTGLCWSPSAGELLVAHSHMSKVLRYSADLELRGEWGQVGREPGQLLIVTGIAEHEGRVYLTDDGEGEARLQVFDLEGNYLEGIGRYGWDAGEFRRPMAVALDPPRGRLAVADALNHRVQLFSLEGLEFQAQWGGLGEDLGQLKQPHDLEFDAAGRLWVMDFGNHRLAVYGPEGAPLGVWGGPGRGDAQLAYPWGLTLVGELVAIADAANDRVVHVERGQLGF